MHTRHQSPIGDIKPESEEPQPEPIQPQTAQDPELPAPDGTTTATDVETTPPAENNTATEQDRPAEQQPASGAPDGSDSGVPRSYSTPQLITDKSERLRWTSELHGCFVRAVETCGGPMTAKPKEILETMNVPGLSLAQCKSHLQKYRISHQNKLAKEGKGETPEEKRRRIDSSPLLPPFIPGTLTTMSMPLPASFALPPGPASLPIGITSRPLGVAGVGDSIPLLTATSVPMDHQFHNHSSHAVTGNGGGNGGRSSSPRLQDLSSDAAQKLQQALSQLVSEATGTNHNHIGSNTDPNGGSGGQQQQQQRAGGGNGSGGHLPPSAFGPPPRSSHQSPSAAAALQPLPPLPPPPPPPGSGWQQQQGVRGRAPAPPHQSVVDAVQALQAAEGWSTDQRQLLMSALLQSPALQLAQLVELALQQQMSSTLALYTDLQKLLEQQHVVTQHVNQKLLHLIETTQHLQNQSLAPFLSRLSENLPDAPQQQQKQPALQLPPPPPASNALAALQLALQQHQQVAGGAGGGLGSPMEYQTFQEDPSRQQQQSPAVMMLSAHVIGGSPPPQQQQQQEGGGDGDIDNAAAGELLQLLQGLSRQMAGNRPQQ